MNYIITHRENGDRLSNIFLQCLEIIKDTTSLKNFINELGLDFDYTGSGILSLPNGRFNFGEFYVTLITDEDFISKFKPTGVSNEIISLRGGAFMDNKDQYTAGLNIPNLITSSVISETGINTEGVAYFHSWVESNYLILPLLIAFAIYSVASHSNKPKLAIKAFADKTGLNKFQFNFSIVRSAFDAFKVLTLRGLCCSNRSFNSLEEYVSKFAKNPLSLTPIRFRNVYINRIEVVIMLGPYLNLLAIRVDKVMHSVLLYSLNDEEVNNYFTKYDICSRDRVAAKNHLDPKVKQNIVKSFRRFRSMKG